MDPVNERPEDPFGDRLRQELFPRLLEEVYVVDLEGRLVYSSGDPAHAVQRGCHFSEALDGYQIFAADGKTPIPASELSPARALRGLETPQRILRIHAPDGQERCVRNCGFPLRGDDGTILGAITLALDMTNERELERRLAELQLELVRVRGQIKDESPAEDRAELFHVANLGVTGEMAAAMAHQINQPLSTITLYARALQRRLGDREDMPADILQALQSISDQALRAGNMVRDMRRFARGAALAPERVTLEQFVEATRFLLEHEARRHSAQVELDIPPSLPAVRVDVAQLQQVLLNLVRNALESLDALGDGSPPPERATVRVTAHAPGPGRVELQVIDRGIGIAEHDTRTLFEAFHSTKEGRTGLGLPISRGIVENHGGQLWLRPNADGPGTTSGFTLPAFDGNEQDAKHG